MSGVGFSFGVDRIYDVMEELNQKDVEINVKNDIEYNVKLVLESVKQAIEYII